MLPTVFAGLASGFSILQITRENLRATQVIIQRMEAIRLSGFNQLKDPTKYPPSVTEYYSESGKTNGNGGVAYTVTYSAAAAPTTLPPTYRTNVLEVRVGVSWASGNVLRSREMRTFVARSGVQSYISGN